MADFDLEPSGTFMCSVDVADAVDEHVVEEVHHNRDREAVIEGEQEEVHTAEPGVHESDDSLVLMAVSESAIREDHRAPNSPAISIEEDVVELIEREEVRDGPEAVFVGDLPQTEGRSVEHEDQGYSDVEEEPPKDDFLKKSCTGAYLESASQEEFRVTVLDPIVTRRKREERRGAHAPCEDGPGARDYAQIEMVDAPEFEEGKGNRFREEEVDQSNKGREDRRYEGETNHLLGDVVFLDADGPRQVTSPKFG